MRKIVGVLVFLFIFFSPSSASAVEELIPQSELGMGDFFEYEKLNPDSLFYIFKRAGEELTLTIIRDQEKRERYKRTLLKKRFCELVYIINRQKTGFLEEVINRYGSYVDSLNKDFVDEVIKKEAKKRIIILEKLRDKYPSNTSYWLQVQQAIDITKRML